MVIKKYVKIMVIIIKYIQYQQRRILDIFCKKPITYNILIVSNSL